MIDDMTLISEKFHYLLLNGMCSFFCRHYQYCEKMFLVFSFNFANATKITHQFPSFICSWGVLGRNIWYIFVETYLIIISPISLICAVCSVFFAVYRDLLLAYLQNQIQTPWHSIPVFYANETNYNLLVCFLLDICTCGW